MQKVAIIDTGSANLNSVLQALKRLECEVEVSSDIEILKKADRLIFPGVGAAAAVMQGIAERKLLDFILQNKKPLLGICLGMQVLAQSSQEIPLGSKDNSIKTLGIMDEQVLRLDAKGGRLPHMGWNTVKHNDHPLFHNIKDEAFFYFDHSFAMEIGPDAIGITEYGSAFASAVSKDNFMGVQFHPEKSGAVGARLLQNFLENF